MITGGTGSFGNAVLRRFLTSDIKEIRIFSRDEKKQDDMRHEYQAKFPEVSHKIKFYIGDVRDLQSVKNAMHGVDYIFHAAALKQVPSCEFFPVEAVKTNVLGTDNVLTAAIEAGVNGINGELIKLLGMPFECISVDADETTCRTNPAEAVAEISEKKARAALAARKSQDCSQDGLQPNEVIIGADTVVAYNGEILGKPLDDADAERMLIALSGNTHFVYTGVTLLYYDKAGQISQLSFAEKTEVHFADISLEDIHRYISTGNHRDKAGSYAIQDEFSVHVTGINGDYNNVVGFPVARLYKELKAILKI